MTFDASKFKMLIHPGSNVYVRHYLDNQSYMPIFSRMRCPHNKIIIVKIFLYQILPEVDKILYLDTDMVNFKPISQLWRYNMANKTLAASYRDRYAWVNSGIVFYNLAYIRKQPESLWSCIRRKRVCYVDDVWHTYCHRKSEKIIILYRYNVDIGVTRQKGLNQYYKREIANSVFIHLQGGKDVYFLTNRSAVKNLRIINGSAITLQKMEHIYDLKEIMEKKLKKSIN